MLPKHQHARAPETSAIFCRWDSPVHTHTKKIISEIIPPLGKAFSVSGLTGHDVKPQTERKDKKTRKNPRPWWTLCPFSDLLSPLPLLHLELSDLQPVWSHVRTGGLSDPRIHPYSSEDPLRPRKKFSHRLDFERDSELSEWHNFLSVQIPRYLLLLRNFQGVSYMIWLLFCWTTEGSYRQPVTLGENIPKDWSMTAKKPNNSWKEKG